MNAFNDLPGNPLNENLPIKRSRDCQEVVPYHCLQRTPQRMHIFRSTVASHASESNRIGWNLARPLMEQCAAAVLNK